MILNKPKGVVSTASDPQGRPIVVELVGSTRRLYPVGRLDAESSGLLLLTNDGELANRLTHPRYGVKKTYLASVRGRVSDRALERLRTGVRRDAGLTAPAKVQVRRLADHSSSLEITLTEGRKRQIRRMCELVGHPVKQLKRVRFGSLDLGRLKKGEYRHLTEAELRKLCKNPSDRKG